MSRIYAIILTSWSNRQIWKYRKLYLILRSEKSANWPHYLPIATRLVNDRPLKRIGNLAPSTINSLVDDVKVREARRRNSVKVPIEENYKDQNREQKEYEKSGKFHVNDYVYLDYKSKTFSKSFDLQASYVRQIKILSS